jgi:protein SCO1
MNRTALLLCSALLFCCRADESAPDIEGENYDGRSFRLSELRGRVVVLFFGYTFCPDICQMTLFRLNEVATALGEGSSDVAFVFVTVDPERDSAAKMKEHIAAFNDQFFGVRARDLKKTMRDYQLVAETRGPDSPNGYYALDHTGTIFIIDAKGAIRDRAPHTEESAALLERVKKIR